MQLLKNKAPRTRSVLLAAGLLAVGVSSFAVAGTGDPLREGKRNGTTLRETEVVSNIASSTGLKGGYSTRQSNLSASGGGAIYGCRSQAGGSKAAPQPQNPCVRANNLSRGLAFEFQGTLGDVVGTITAGAGGDTKKPFTTNATGVATGLNADRVDNLDATQIVAAAHDPFALISSQGVVTQSRGLIATTPVTYTPPGVYKITFTGDLTKCAVSATLTGNTLGEILADPALVGTNTVVTVNTGTSAGAPSDRRFDLAFNC
jgi:hypothetical protein